MCVRVYAHACLHVRMGMGTQACGNPWLIFCLSQALSTLFTEASLSVTPSIGGEHLTGGEHLACNPSTVGGCSLPVTPALRESFPIIPALEGAGLSVTPALWEDCTQRQKVHWNFWARTKSPRFRKKL